MPNPLTLITTASSSGAKPDAPRGKDAESKIGFAFEKAMEEEAGLQDVDKEAEITVTDQVALPDPSDGDVQEAARPSDPQVPAEENTDPPEIGLIRTPDVPVGVEVEHSERVPDRVLPGESVRADSQLASTRGATVLPPDPPKAASQADGSKPAEPVENDVTRHQPKAEQSVAAQPQIVVSVMEAITRNRQQEPLLKTPIAEPTALPSNQPMQAAMPSTSVPVPQVALPKLNGAEESVGPEADLLDLPPLREAAVSHALRDSTPAMPLPPARTETARAIASQMAAVISAKPGAGGVEIALNPEELGRVSITLNGRDDGMHMMIMAERPETLDLMRRHIAILSAEFEKLGYDGLSLDFGSSGDTSTEREQPDSEPFFNTTEPASGSDSTARPIQIGPDQGLDMRV